MCGTLLIQSHCIVTVYSGSGRRVLWAALSMSLVGLSPVLLARLLGLRLSGVVRVLLVCPERVVAWSNIALSPLVLSPLVLRPDKFWEKVGHPWWWYLPGPGCHAAGGVYCPKGSDPCGGMLHGGAVAVVA